MPPIVVHLHCYQPPRDEPWLELVPREPSAAPDHDWNARITRECYAPLAAARVLDGAGRVRDIINSYAWCSFNAGPTLFRWLEHHAADVAAAMVAGDHASAERLGVGNAIASPYHHVILPLASLRDKRTEVRWGIREFRHTFGRDPLGMWLPETAVDAETLQVLLDEGIRFTILSPHQAPNLPPHGGMGRWVGAGGRALTLCTYDGQLAHDVAFGDLLTDAAHFTDRLQRGTGEYNALATDGETFGHHHRFGDLALAATIDRLRSGGSSPLTNFAALLHARGELPTVELHEPSSWSCSHGVERWRIECGCRFDPATRQDWRAPLRVGLEVVAHGVHAIVTRDWPADAGDPSAVRDAAGPDLDGVSGLPVAARRLLEAERHAMAMFTSCAWFFDDIARIEPRLVLRHAARALDFLPNSDAAALAETLRGALRQAPSNDPSKGTGEDVWLRDVLPHAEGPQRLAAGLAALRELDPALLDTLDMPTHAWELLPAGVATVHRRTGRRLVWHTTPVIAGIVAARVHVRGDAGRDSAVIPLHRFPAPVLALLRARVTPQVLEAILPLRERERMRLGLLDPEDARRAALLAAWSLLDTTGLEEAHPVLHAILDLWVLEELPIPEAVVASAYRALSAIPRSQLRDALAERVGLALPDR